MEIKKLKRRLTAAYHYSFIRMTLNFYTCYEMQKRLVNRMPGCWRYMRDILDFLALFWKKRACL